MRVLTSAPDLPVTEERSPLAGRKDAPAILNRCYVMSGTVAEHGSKSRCRRFLLLYAILVVLLLAIAARYVQP